MGYNTGSELLKYKTKERRTELNVQRFLGTIHIVKCSNQYRGYIHFPKGMIGKRIKVVIVDEE